MSEKLLFTTGVPAFDHHSHAGYVRPGENLEGIDALEREYAMGHVEANLPPGVYDRYIGAVYASDSVALRDLEKNYSINALVEASRRFQSTTIHAISLREGCRVLYGDLARDEWDRVSRERRMTDFPDLYDQALETTDTAAVLTDIPSIDATAWSPTRYLPIARIDPYLYPFGHPTVTGRGADVPRFQRIFATILQDLYSAEGLTSTPDTLDDYVDFVRTSLARRRANGFVGLKIASAYVRSLHFVRRDGLEAQTAFKTLQSGHEVDREAYAALTDYLVFAIAEMAVSLELPMQIHTGMGHTEPGLRLVNADPRNLEAFLSDPQLNNLRVVLIHGGYPYSSALAALSQAYGNVFVDFSWMPYLQHHTVERLLQEWLEILPANKVLFGTDTGHPEFHVAATRRARMHLDRALTSGVSAGNWEPAQAEWLARRVLHQNLCDVYQVPLP